MKKILYFIAAAVALMGSIQYTRVQANSSQIVAQAPSASADEELKPPKPPTYPGNADKKADQLITKEKAIGKISPKAKVTKAELKAWKDFERTAFRGAKVHDISPDRQIWDIVIEYTEEIAYGGGKCVKDAKVSRAVDAETGKTLGIRIGCKPENYVDFHGWDMKQQPPAPEPK